MKMKNLKRLVKQTEAVSPVVATLMLVLVAAGAAVGLNLFMNSFQEDATQDVGMPDGTHTLRIAGSSTVYEFSRAALQGDAAKGLPAFEDFAAQSGTPIKVELEKGGSGAGRKAAGLCLVDIGSSSSPVKAEEFDTYPDCDRDGQKDYGMQLEVFKVATDGVVFASDASYLTAHCTNGPVQFTQDVALALYLYNGNPGAGAPANPGATAVDSDGDGVGDAALDTSTDGTIQWDELPVDDAGTRCAGASSADPVQVFDREDPGGTSEIASEKLFGQKQSQLEDFDVHVTDQGDGNQGVWEIAEGESDGILFTSYGYAVAQGMKIHDFGADWDSIRTPTSSNIASEDYDATRPILYITAGEPTPVEQVWLDFVMNAHRNQLIAGNADFESIY